MKFDKENNNATGLGKLAKPNSESKVRAENTCIQNKLKYNAGAFEGIKLSLWMHMGKIHDMLTCIDMFRYLDVGICDI